MTEQQSSPDDEKRTQREFPAASKPAGPTFAEPEQTVADLSPEIVKALPKSARERVTCRRITGNHYRCNWWSPSDTSDYDNPMMRGLTVTTHRVSKSQVLHVTKSSGELCIKPLAAG